MSITDKILVLTPVKDGAAMLVGYFAGLSRLSYPQKLISVGLLESDSTDHTYESLLEMLPSLRQEFHEILVLKKDFGFHIPQGTPRWANHVQIQRRAVLAKSRNYLLSRALQDEDWVLWLDVDVVEYPDDIIQRLLQTGKDIVQPHCVKEYGGPSFDRNAWRDKGKLHLDDMRGPEALVRLDAVGGSILMVRADIHREGLVFPTFLYGRRNPRIRRRNGFITLRQRLVQSLLRLISPKSGQPDISERSYSGEIETEGMGIMAHDMGYECWGMPNLEVRHIDK